MLETPLKKAFRTTAKHIKLLEILGLKNVRDLLLYFPRGYTDASETNSLSHIQIGELNTFEGYLSNYFNRRTKTGKFLTKALFTDDSGSIDILWFNQPHVTRMFPAGKRVLLTGKPKMNMKRITLMNPIGELKKENQLHTGRIVPVYHETKGLTSKWLRGKIQPILEMYIHELQDPLPQEIREKLNLISYKKAVQEVHFPTDDRSLEEAKKRLAFDELFILQLKVLQKKWYWQHHFGMEDGDTRKIKIENEKLDAFIKSLPFKLTNAQKKTLDEILEDLQRPYAMARLVQGDVGSGKTIVAGIAAKVTMDNGKQVALMAPTEILAKQHYKTLAKLFIPQGINIQILLGSTPEKVKKEIYNAIATGTVDIVIGTHALIQEGVTFRKLGLAIIDEQHRFGVKQRNILKEQGTPHLLSLSATPIPRTLAMTIYGDQDLSIIDELPPGRKPIITRIVPEEKRNDAYEWIEKQIAEGRQVFIVCPLIDESDEMQSKSVIKEYEHLATNIFPKLKLAFLHGRLKQEEKDDIMDRFSKNETNILVSTSVIEVGIDVPNATIMIIEGAEHFGLSQLHQFRGRVGRGEHQSYCFLFTNKETPQATHRLKAMTEHQSGFKLAEIDLELRGPGEIYGARQSGIPDLKMASLSDSKVIAQARATAEKIIAEDPLLKKTEHEPLQALIAEKEEVYIKD